MTLILASSSPYRRELLSQAGYNPQIVKPKVDESITKKKYLDAGPLVIAQKLARIKSENVLNQITFKAPFVILGSDQVCVHNNEILDKPGNFENNRAHLQRLQSDTHSLITAVCCIIKKSADMPEDYIEFYDQTDLLMKPLTDLQIEEYLKADQPFDCAGGYKFESLGHTLIAEITSKDKTAIQGLPMNQCLQIFKDFGV